MAQLREWIDRYEIQEVVGRGAMGIVYRARDPVIGRVVALKTIDLPAEVPGDQTADCVERFAREARAAGLLSHPNIVTVYDIGRAGPDGSSYIAMEFVEGRSLRQLVPPGGRASPEEILDIALQVARALDHAHRRGIVHRDVKPANILVRSDGLVKLADFGVARLGASDLTRSGQSVGSPSYIAPEVLSGGAIDGRADLFSFGVILYELLAGQRPFRAESLPALYHQILSETPAPPSSRDPGVPPEWDAVVMRLLAKQPEDRYESAAVLIEDLHRLEQGRPLRVGPVPGAATGGPGSDVLPDWVLEEISGEGAPRAVLHPHRKALTAFLTVTGFALLVIAVAVLVREASSEPRRAAVQRDAVESSSADLTLRLSHALKAGRIRLTIDGRTTLEAAFRGERAGMRYQGALSRKVEVPEGRHVFRVMVEDADGRQWSGVTTREVARGTDPTLFVEVKGLLKKSLETTWY